MEGVKDIEKIIEDSVQDANKCPLPPPTHLKDAMAVLEKCVMGIAEAFDRMDGMNSIKRFFRRRELKADAEACAADVARALEVFQVCVVTFSPFTLGSNCYVDEATNQGRSSDERCSQHYHRWRHHIRRWTGYSRSPGGHGP